MTGLKAQGRWPGTGWLPIKADPCNWPAPVVTGPEHRHGRRGEEKLAIRERLSWFDALIAAAAIRSRLAACLGSSEASD